MAQPASPSQTIPASPSQTISITQRLLGKWQQQGTPPGETFAIVFGSDSKAAFFISTPEWTIAFHSGYKVDANAQPMRLNFSHASNSDAKVFDFTTDGQLRLQGIGQVQPSGFSVFKKISTKPTLLLEPQIVARPAQANPSPESEGRLYTSSMHQAQQAYYLKNSAFASTIAQLGLDLKPETENYHYQIELPGNAGEQVRVIGRAKRPELKSFTGAVFKTQVDNRYNILLGVVCQTERPSLTPPAMPFLDGTRPQCPAGSQPAIY
ncbi:type IV pilin-like G/H family protein [Leptothermofonsia sp. ETS-13]|uniref:type IV pilin-like G/H family protein n=1 Tax=Leptothermofonsia sp. ETS-13 TaxID=3035696 RepID=UPI003BA32924